MLLQTTIICSPHMCFDFSKAGLVELFALRGHATDNPPRLINQSDTLFVVNVENTEL